MRRQIENAVAEQLALLDRGACGAAEFRRAIGRLADTSSDARQLISSILAGLRRSGGLSHEAERLIQPFLTPGFQGATVDLHSNLTRPPGEVLEASDSIAIGHVLRERYVILEKLGAGRTGAVFRALDRYRTSLAGVERQVALKVIRVSGENRDRTLRDLALELHEGQALSHRNVLKVFDLDRDGDVIFSTMELLDGQSLSALLEEAAPSRMHLTQAWRIIRQLAAGLQHAHERGVVHGGLTPRNIWVTQRGEVRILDFGSVRVREGLRSKAGPDDIDLPPGGSAYASCELLEGRAADPRDDLYALSCIAYEMLTGSHPFASRPAILARNFGVRAAKPAVLGSSQWKALRTGLAWHRAGRSQSVRAWLQELDRASPPFSQSRAAIAGFAVTSLVVGVAVLGNLAQAPHSNASGGAPALAQTRIIDVAAAASSDTAQTITPPVKPARPSALRLSVDGYQVIPGNRFVEVRVRRNQLRDNATFTWWTEPATAKQGVDYVHQANALQTFPTGRRSTRFYIKLLPETGRSQRDFFYVAIAPVGHAHLSTRVMRAQIWLPSPREPLQASR